MIPYYAINSKIMGNVTGGLLLSYLVDRLESVEEAQITDSEIKQDTGLTEWELRNAKRTLKSIGAILVERKGLPAKTHYRIDRDKYEKIARETIKGATSQ